MTFNAPVRVKGSALGAKRAGDGGNGGTPHIGGSGGGRIGSCAGGAGGTGGDGGTGAGGAGGLSAGIVHKGGVPVTDAATEAAITTGKAGALGAGGTSPANDGKPGDAKKILAL